MKFLFSFALPALLALSLFARPSAAQPAMLSAREVLDAAAQTYAALEIYQGTCSVVNDSAYSTSESVATTHAVSSATAKISFQRDRKLNVTGNSPMGGSFDATTTPAGSIIEVTASRGQAIRIYDVTGEKAANREEFIASMTGISGGTGLTIPAALITDGELNPFRGAGTLSAPEVRDLGATACYVVKQTDEERKSVHTFWIEKSSFLLRRLETEMGTIIAPKMTAEEIKEYPQLAEMPQMTVLYTNTLMVFSNETAR